MKVAYNPVGVAEIALAIVLLTAFLFMLSFYYPILPRADTYMPLIPGSYVALNNAFLNGNVFESNSLEVLEGAKLYYLYFPADSIHFNKKPLYLLCDASFLRDEIGGGYEGEPFEIYPFACADIPEAYVPENDFSTRSAINAKAGEVFCVRSLFGNKKEAQFGIAGVSEEAITLQVISVEGG